MQLRKYLSGNTVYYWTGFLFGLSFIWIRYLREITFLYTYIFITGKILLAIICIPIIVQAMFTKKDLTTFFVLAVFCALLFFETVWNKGDVIETAIFALSILFVPLFFFSLPDKYFFQVLKGLAFFLKIVLLCEFASMILFRETGLYTINAPSKNFYFIGHTNASVKTTLPAVTLFAVLDYHAKKRISWVTAAYTIALLLCCIYVDAMTALVGTIAYIVVLYIYLRHEKFARKIPAEAPIYVSLAVFLLICLLQATNLRPIIESVVLMLGRTVTFSGRTLIWDRAVKAIASNIWGYGYISDYSTWLRFGDYTPSSTHNIYLDLLMQVGIPGIILFLIYLFRVVKAVKKVKVPQNAKCLLPLQASLFAIMLMWNFEPYFSADVFFGGWICLSVAYVIGMRKQRRGI